MAVVQVIGASARARPATTLLGGRLEENVGIME